MMVIAGCGTAGGYPGRGNLPEPYLEANCDCTIPRVEFRLYTVQLSLLPIIPRCPFHKFAASQAAARLYGLGGYKARSNR